MRKLLIIGLGNYTHPTTRHSVGFTFLDHFASRHGFPAWTADKSLPGWTSSKADIAKAEVHLFKPGELMNICGRSVKRCMEKCGIRKDAEGGSGWAGSVMVVHDEMEKEAGKFAVKVGGSAGGHNGLKSVISHLKSDTFSRLRLGISRPTSTDPSVVAHYVLSKFPREDLEALEEEVFPRAARVVEEWCAGGGTAGKVKVGQVGKQGKAPGLAGGQGRVQQTGRDKGAAR